MKQKTKYTPIITAAAISTSRWLPLVALAALLAGCTKMEDAAALPAASATRTAIIANGQTTWATGDAVGVFMLTAGGTMPDDIILGTDNIKYTVAPSTGALSPAGTPVYYPQTGKVDFIALYPYSDKGTGNGKISADYKYGISVADQTNPETIDVLYAKATGQERSKTPVALSFGHVLSKIKLDINFGQGMTGLAADRITTVTLSGMPASATLALQDGTLAPGAVGNIAVVKEATPSAGATTTFTALVPPQEAGVYTRRSIIVTVNGEKYTGTIPAADAFVSNGMYIYPVTVQKSGITIGTPTIAKWTTKDHGSGEAEIFPSN